MVDLANLRINCLRMGEASKFANLEVNCNEVLQHIILILFLVLATVDKLLDRKTKIN